MTSWGGGMCSQRAPRARRAGAVAGLVAIVSAVGLVAPAATMADSKSDLLPPVQATILGTPLKVGDLGLRGAPLAQAVPEPVRKVVRESARGVSLDVEPLDTAVAVQEKKDLARTRPIVDEASTGDRDTGERDTEPTETEIPVVGRSENSLGAPRPVLDLGPIANPDPFARPTTSAGNSDPSVLSYGPRDQALSAALEEEWSTLPKYLAAAVPLLVTMLILLAIVTRRRADSAEPAVPTFERRRHAR
ncbi:MAG: hypothetical protein ACT4P1_02355 [Sporichthyaceae bacterium]